MIDAVGFRRHSNCSCWALRSSHALTYLLLLLAADRVYWQMIDSMPHIAERLQPDEDDEPMHIRLTHPASGNVWEVPLQFDAHGLRFEVGGIYDCGPQGWEVGTVGLAVWARAMAY